MPTKPVQYPNHLCTDLGWGRKRPDVDYKLGQRWGVLVIKWALRPVVPVVLTDLGDGAGFVTGALEGSKGFCSASE